MRIGIYDDNIYYLNRVCEIMNEKYSNDLTFVQLMEKDINATNANSFDMLLLDYKFGKITDISTPIVYLTEEKGPLVREDAVFIFKYYNAQTLHDSLPEAIETVIRIREQKEQERLVREQKERERIEREQREKAERERIERERREKAERERIEREQREKAEREQAEREQREKAERERIEREQRQKAEKERIAREQREAAEKERIEKEWREKAEKERIKEEYIDISNLNCKIITYMSLGGGMGSSTVAAGTAEYFARTGKRVLYFNLKPLSAAGYFDVSEDNISMSGIVAELRGSETGKDNAYALFDNIFMNSNGVYIINNFNNYFETENLSDYTFRRFLTLADNVGKFDIVVVDMNVSVSEYTKAVLRASNRICYVVDGSDYCNERIFRANSFVTNIDEELAGKQRIIYNKYKVMPKVEKGIEDKVIGGISYVGSENPQDVIKKMANMKFLNNLLK